MAVCNRCHDAKSPTKACTDSHREIAILMAAGFGSRMRPLTDKMAKPLVRVNGVRLIDTLMKVLKKREVSDIFIVTGYKSEQFESIANEYPNVHLVHNPEYATMNNINSIGSSGISVGRFWHHKFIYPLQRLVHFAFCQATEFQSKNRIASRG